MGRQVDVQFFGLWGFGQVIENGMSRHSFTNVEVHPIAVPLGDRKYVSGGRSPAASLSPGTLQEFTTFGFESGDQIR